MDTTRARFSHYLGVSWNKQTQQWQARFHKPDGNSHLVGGFKEEEEAGRAYDEYALKHHGNGAVRNFPPSTYTGETVLVSAATFNKNLTAFFVKFLLEVSLDFKSTTEKLSLFQMAV